MSRCFFVAGVFFLENVLNIFVNYLSKVCEDGEDF